MAAGRAASAVDHPHWDRDDVHDIYRSWRALADTYDDPRVFVAEAWVHNPERLAQYVRDDELHTAFNFDFLLAPWEAEPMRESIIASLSAHEAVGAPPTWVLSNHDTVREVSRYARPQGVRAAAQPQRPARPPRRLRRWAASGLGPPHC